MFKKLTQWLDRDSRARERRKLAAELDELDADEEFIRCRKPQIIERMQLLAQLDSDADVRSLRNVVFTSGDVDAIPRTGLGDRRFYVVEDDACLPFPLHASGPGSEAFHLTPAAPCAPFEVDGLAGEWRGPK